MEKETNRKVKAHNVVVFIITISCIAVIVDSITKGWEMWVPPLITGGIVASWFFHISQYDTERFRENFYLIFAMVVAFYHGMHSSSYFDVIVISALLMVTATLIKRKEYLDLLLTEFLSIMAMHTIWAIITKSTELDSITISRIALQIISEACIYKGLLEILKYIIIMENELKQKELVEEVVREGMEDFLVNISHELRTPVNVINGMSSLILKKEVRDDVLAIMGAGRRLSRQIEDIQDYTEIERGDSVLEIDKYSITSVLNDIVMNYNAMEYKKELDFLIDLDPEVPEIMKGDSNKVKKIIIHLLDNAFKFTKAGGVYLRITGTRRDYGINLIIKVTDTGIGMTKRDIDQVSKGHYQADKKRNRSSGGIGLGLSIVYGFVRMMEGFVSIDSSRDKGTTVSVSIVQEIVDSSPCLSVSDTKNINVAFHVFPQKFRITAVREFYVSMASNMALGLKLNLYNAPNLNELKKLLEKGKITHIFIGSDEYRNEPGFFDELANSNIVVTICTESGITLRKNSRVIVMPKPLYAYPVVKILNGEYYNIEASTDREDMASLLKGVKALIVDDEPMNLVVATGLFKDYDMVIDTAGSGKESLLKYDLNDYEVIFMDHMMPEMDGIEAMKKLRLMSDQKRKPVKIVALTANAISGAREMFLKEGFDGFISKPINIGDFERVMKRILSDRKSSHNGGIR
ncbi:hybrid sensor histidine kinase/response regulator [Butyrivibrio sp. YAB3001]|uniref:hybrid sensor histidine kinase/response regulator n=1 Tax=Butyrivibrio sp. YAB3001 TaxID=1520812 RepID=UPI0008F68612|nr:ATP-binding protein [Butyrivibrio sp. YAB3001]SFD05774.1 Signal transduction histidine kinase [Butyrivibrio sp. YAB3001]